MLVTYFKSAPTIARYSVEGICIGLVHLLCEANFERYRRPAAP